MKIIDLLNKIANGEIETFYKFQYRNKIVTMEYLLDNYLFLEILNDEIEFIEDTSKEEKKITEKINTIGSKWYSNYIESYIDEEDKYSCYDELLMNKINEIIDYLYYLKSKSE